MLFIFDKCRFVLVLEQITYNDQRKPEFLLLTNVCRKYTSGAKTAPDFFYMEPEPQHSSEA
jgi:hypothetical protein